MLANKSRARSTIYMISISMLEESNNAICLLFEFLESTAAICVFFVEGSCLKGAQCPFRHVRGDRTIVCKHWLRGLCKKGDQCEFLHEYDMTKMPECYFYTRFSKSFFHGFMPEKSLIEFFGLTDACHNKECPFLHIDPESKVRPCPWYDRGFCRHGPNCRHRHVRKVLCLNYLAGFCPDGKECKFVQYVVRTLLGIGNRCLKTFFRSPQFDLPQLDEIAKNARKAGIICHLCQEAGHKSYQCPKNQEAQMQGDGEGGTSVPPSNDAPETPHGAGQPRTGMYMNPGDNQGYRPRGYFPLHQHISLTSFTQGLRSRKETGRRGRKVDQMVFITEGLSKMLYAIRLPTFCPIILKAWNEIFNWTYFCFEF